MAKQAARNTKMDTRETRESREQETREAEGVHEDEISFELEGPFPDIKPREGYAQRWIRVKNRSENDARNMYAAARRGWRPRDPKTVPQQQQFLTVQREGLGGCIGTHDCVLMERRTEIHAQEAEIKRRDRRERMRAVKHNLFSEYGNLGGADSGFTAPSDESKARVEKGRMPEVQDD